MHTYFSSVRKCITQKGLLLGLKGGKMMLIQSCHNRVWCLLPTLYPGGIYAFHFNFSLRLMDSPNIKRSEYLNSFLFRWKCPFNSPIPALLKSVLLQEAWACKKYLRFLTVNFRKISFFRKCWAHSPDKALYTKYFGKMLRFLPSDSIQLDLRQPTARQNQVSTSQDGPSVAKQEPRWRLQKVGDWCLSQT